MDTIRDSSDLVEDWEALRARIRADGYVFVRNLVDRTVLAEAADVALDRLRQGGWLAASSTPDRLIPGGPTRPTEQGRAWSDPGFREFALSAAFNRIPYTPSLDSFMRRLMGATAFTYPAKVARVVYPTSMVPTHRGQWIHQDFAVLGVPDQFTTWVPLVDIPRSLGGLAVLPGSQGWGPAPPAVLYPHQQGWRTTDFRMGDVLVVHSLTAHAALPNETGRMRLSAEFRWQLPDVPAPARLILGPRPSGGGELFGRLFAGQPWWRPVPAGLHLQPDGPPPTSIPPSRYVDAPVGAPTRWVPAGGGPAAAFGGPAGPGTTPQR